MPDDSVPARDEPDPFAGLVLDESFIAAATRYEAPARTREAIARFGPLEDTRRQLEPTPGGRRRGASRRTPRAAASRRAEPSGPPAHVSGQHPPRSRPYMVLTVISVLLLAGFAYSLLRSMTYNPPRTAVTTGSTAGSGTAPGDPPATAGPAGESDTSLHRPQWQWSTGRCYTWVQTTPDSPVNDVPCAGEHLFEMAGPLDISPVFPADHEFPSRAQWNTVRNTHCSPVIRGYLGYDLDPAGRFVAGIIKPGRAAWDDGDRNILCGLSAADPPGQADDDVYPSFEGSVRGADQAWVDPPGTCYQDGSGTLTVVSCDEPHHTQSVGSARLPDTADGQPPSVERFSELAAAACAASTEPYVGPGPAGAVFQTSWHFIRAESWRAGTRTTTCTVRLVDADGRLRETTGPLAPTSDRAAAGIAV